MQHGLPGAFQRTSRTVRSFPGRRPQQLRCSKAECAGWRPRPRQPGQALHQCVKLMAHHTRTTGLGFQHPPRSSDSHPSSAAAATCSPACRAARVSERYVLNVKFPADPEKQQIQRAKHAVWRNTSCFLFCKQPCSSTSRYSRPTRRRTTIQNGKSPQALACGLLRFHMY